MQVIFYLLFPYSPKSSSTSLTLHYDAFDPFQRASKVFLYTCLNHLNLFSRIFAEIGATPSFSLKSWFLIQSILLLPHIHLNILISVTSILYSKVFFIGQHSVPYSKVSLIATRQNLLFNLHGNFLSHCKTGSCSLLEPIYLYLISQISYNLPITLNNRSQKLKLGRTCNNFITNSHLWHLYR